MNFEESLTSLRLRGWNNTYGSFAQNNLLQNALDGFSRALEPLMYLQQLGYGTAIGLKTGDWDKFKRTLGETATYMPFGARPTLTTGYEVAEIFGVKDEKWKALVGLGLDIFADPLMAGTVFRAVGKVAGAKQLVHIGNKLDETISLKTVVTGATRLFPGTKQFAENVFTTIMDTPIKAAFAKRTFPSGVLPERDQYVTLGEAFGRYLPGAARSGSRAVQDVAEQVTGSERIGVGIMDFGRAAQEEVQKRMHNLINRTQERVRQFDPSGGTVYNKFMEITGAFLDDLGKPKTAQQQLGALGVFSAISSTNTALIGATAEQLLKVAPNRLKYLRALRRTYEIADPTIRGNFADWVKAMEEVAADAYSQVAVISYKLSGYDDFVELMTDTASSAALAAHNLQPYDIIAHKWLRAIGVQSNLDLTPVGKTTLGKIVDDAINQTRRTNNTKYGMLRFNAFKPEEYLQGLAEGYMRRAFAVQINPDAAQAVIEKGFVIPFETIDAKAFTDIFRQHFTTLYGANVGQNIAQDINNYMRSTVTGRVITGDIIEIAQRHLPPGEKVKPAEIRFLLEQTTPDALLVEDTLKKIDAARAKEIHTRNQPRYSRDLYTFKHREELSDSDRKAMLQIFRLDEALNEFAKAAGPTARKQTYMAMVFDELAKNNLIFDAKDLAQMGIISSPKQTRAVLGGIDMVQIGRDPRIWGGYAGKMIPKVFAREMMTIAQMPIERQTGLYQQLLSAIRRSYLSPLPTAMRNALGSIALLHTAKVPVDELLPYLRKAHEAVMNNELLGEAQFILNFATDATLSKQINEDAFRFFEGILKEAVRSRTPLDKLAELTQRIDNAAIGRVAETGRVLGGALGEMVLGGMRRDAATVGEAVGETVAKAIYGGGFTRPAESPMLGGFLHLFQYYEDLTRAAVYMWAKDGLEKAGVAGAEAIRRAARVSNVSTYDYTSAGLLVDMLRRSGLGLFPAFTWFTIGRTARTFYERPALLAQQEKLVSAANAVFVQDPHERDAVDAMLLDYWAAQYRPIVIPQRDGKYLLVPTNYLMPHGMISAGEVENIFWEMAAGGAWRPLVDAFHALQGGPRGDEPGKPTPLTQRFQQEVFAPDEAGTPTAYMKTAQFVATSYAPGTWMRTLFPMAMKVWGIDPARMAELEETQVKYFNVSPLQVGMRLAGLPGYTVGGKVTYTQQMAAFRKEENFELASLRQKMQAAAITGNLAKLEELSRRMMEVQEKYNQKRALVGEGFAVTMDRAR